MWVEPKQCIRRLWRKMLPRLYEKLPNFIEKQKEPARWVPRQNPTKRQNRSQRLPSNLATAHTTMEGERCATINEKRFIGNGIAKKYQRSSYVPNCGWGKLPAMRFSRWFKRRYWKDGRPVSSRLRRFRENVLSILLERKSWVRTDYQLLCKSSCFQDCVTGFFEDCGDMCELYPLHLLPPDAFTKRELLRGHFRLLSGMSWRWGCMRCGLSDVSRSGRKSCRYFNKGKAPRSAGLPLNKRGWSKDLLWPFFMMDETQERTKETDRPS